MNKTQTPREILKASAQAFNQAASVVNALPDDQPVTLPPDVVAQLKNFFRKSA